MKRDHRPWWLPIAALLGATLLRLLGASWRMETRKAPALDAAERAGEKFVYAFWHAGLLPLTYSRRGEGIAVLVSRHRDGELIARILAALGYVTARGSSTRGAEAGVRGMLDWGTRGRQLAITPDGPRGPAERVKDGLVYLAARTGRRVVPIAAATPGAWRLRSWDRFRVPRPFGRVAIAYGDPLTVTAADEPSALERDRDRIESALVELTADVRRDAGEVS